MKKSMIPIVLALSLSPCLLRAQNAVAEGATPTDAAAPANAPPPPSASRPAFRILPPGARERLKLTDDQAKQIDALEAAARETLAKILTPEQLQQLQRMRPPQGRGGPGGPGGGGPGGPGGPGARGGRGGPGGPDGPDGPGGMANDGRPPAPPQSE